MQGWERRGGRRLGDLAAAAAPGHVDLAAAAAAARRGTHWQSCRNWSTRWPDIAAAGGHARVT
jgi:hypothetical protein